MWLTFHHLLRALSGTNRRKTPRRPRVSTCRPRLEALEDRTLLSPYIVTTTADSGAGSLRDAITQVNADTNHTLYASPSNSNVDEIDFNITAASDTGGGFNATSGVATIQPQSALPTITNSVVINGYTQAGASANRITKGDNAAIKIELRGNSSIATGLELSGSSSNGSTIEGLSVNSFGSFETGSMIDLNASNGDTIQGNFIGLDASGESSPTSLVDFSSYINPGQDGILLQDAQNDLIGTNGDGVNDPAERNVISNCGVGVINLASSNNAVAGNFIGTDASGTKEIGNWIGISFGEGCSSNRIGTNGMDADAAGEGNVISGNKFGIVFGIGAVGIAAETGGTVEGNMIGPDVNGNKLDGASGNLSWQGNLGAGIGVLELSSGIQIGGSNPIQANIIAYNQGPGVTLPTFRNEYATHITVQGNSIHDNLGPGIDEGGIYSTSTAPILGPDDASSLSTADGTNTGPNDLQHYPSLIAAQAGSSTTTISGSLSTNNSGPYTLDFYDNGNSPDPSGYGQGKTYLGSAIITNTGNFLVTLPVATSAGDYLTATATDAAGDTSIFSNDIQASSSTILVTNTNDAGSGSLRAAVAQANASIAPTTIEFDLGAGPHTITLTSGPLDLTNTSAKTTIEGPGTADQLAISGNNNSEVFNIAAGARMELDDLTITKGSALFGGGIYNQGDLAINDSILADNGFTGAGAGAGGAIYNDSHSIVTVSNSTLADNTSGQGGGIENQGTAYVINSTLADNSATSGGGISNDDTAYVINSTLADNTSSDEGGGIVNLLGTVHVINSTLADNTATGLGGGIYNGGGNVQLSNSIVAANTSPTGQDLYGDFGSLGNNLIGAADGSTGFTNGINGDIVGTTANPVDPKLAGLANYGGPTQTMALLPGSPAIDAGSDAVVLDLNGNPLTTDQRGQPRIIDSTEDIGAFESNGASLTGLIQQNLSPSNPITVQANSNTEADNLIDAVNQLPSYAIPVTVTLNLAAGVTYSDITAAPPAGVTLVINGQGGTTTIVGNSPALTVTSGNVVVTGMTLTTATDAPTILVTGGSLQLRNDEVENTGNAQADIALTSGSLDLGTAADPGDNIFDINGTGTWFQNTTSSPLVALGDTFEINGALQPATTPTISVTDGGTYNGSAFAATATIAGVNGVASSSLQGVGLTLDYQQLDSQGNVLNDLGATAPTAAGTYKVTASYAGSPNYLAASNSTTFTIAQATPIFSLVAPPTIIDGTSNTQITGAIAAGSLIPNGSVMVTVNGVSLTAAINPDGTFAVTVPTASLGAGSYTIGYFYAGDNNFTSACATANMDVANGVLALFNQSQAKNAGSNIPIQIELVSAGGQDLSSAGTTVIAVGMAATTDTTDKVGSIDPSLVGALQPVQAAGNSNPNNVFREQGGSKAYYMYNLQTPTGLTAGTYRLYIQVQGDPLLHWVTFSVS